MNKSFLGIWDGHDAGAALIAPGVITCAVNEERFSRRKQEIRFPEQSIRYASADASLAGIAYSTNDFAKTLGRYCPWTKEKYYRVRRRKEPPSFAGDRTKSLKYRLTTIGSGFFSKIFSRQYIRYKVRRLGLKNVLVKGYDHHWCHLCAAAFTAGPGDWTVISLDGVGDGRSGAVAVLRDGKLNEIASIKAENSLGVFFEHVTNLLNMRELEDEGKVMALADFARPIPDDQNPLLDFMRVDGLRIRSKGSTSAMYNKLMSVFRCYPSEQFAYMAQRALETCVNNLIHNAVWETGLDRVAYAGGVASNIVANGRVNESPDISHLHVFPQMGDGGLALGAALAMAYAADGYHYFPLEDCCLGPSYDDPSELPTGITPVDTEDPAETAAERLSDGEIIILHAGRMEYGPRALGGRSLLARPDSPEITKKLNLSLKKRVYYQPFCPSMLRSEAEKMLECHKSFNPFMTIGYRVRPEYHTALAGVISPSGICRPQIVPDDTHTPLCRILKAFRGKAGHGILLNTSLNLHGDPLARTPEDSIRIFHEMKIQHAMINNKLYRKDG